MSEVKLGDMVGIPRKLHGCPYTIPAIATRRLILVVTREQLSNGCCTPGIPRCPRCRGSYATIRGCWMR